MRLRFGVFFLAFFLCAGAVNLPEFEHGQPLALCDYARRIHSDTLRFKEEWKRNVAELKKHMIPPEPHKTWKDAMGMSAAEFHYLKNPPSGYMKKQNENSLRINRMRLAALRVDENLPLIRYLPEEHEHDFEDSIEFMVEECDYLRDNENFSGPEPPLPGENGFFSDVGIEFTMDDIAYIPPDGGSHEKPYPLGSKSYLIKHIMTLLNRQYQSDKVKVEADYNLDDYAVTINEDTGYMHVEKSRDRILKDTQEDYIHTNSIGLQLHNIVHHGFHYAVEFSRGILERDNPIHYCAKSVFIAYKSLTRRYYYINFLGRNFPIGVFIPDERLRAPFEKCEKLPRSEQDKCMFAESHKCRNAECQPPHLDDENVEFFTDGTVVGVFIPLDYEGPFKTCMDIDGADLVECLSSEMAKVTEHEVKSETDLDVDNEFDESWYELIKRDCISKLGEEWWVSPSNVEGKIIYTPNSEGYKLQEWRAYCFQQYNQLQETDANAHYAASEGFIPNEKYRRMFENCGGLTGAERDECFTSELAEIERLEDQQTLSIEEDYSSDELDERIRRLDEQLNFVKEALKKIEKYEEPEAPKELEAPKEPERWELEHKRSSSNYFEYCEKLKNDDRFEWSDCNGELQVGLNWPLVCSLGRPMRRCKIPVQPEAEQKQENNHEFHDPETTVDTQKLEESYANGSVDEICEYSAQNGKWSKCNGETQVQVDWPRFCSPRRERYCGTEDAEFKNIDIWTPELREKRNAAFRICRFLRHLSSKDTCPEWIIFSSLSDIERYVVSMLECSKDMLHETPCHAREECAQSGCVKQVVPWCDFFDLEVKLACIKNLKEFGRLTTRELCEQYLAPWIEWSTCRHNHQYILSESKICKDVHYRLCETEGMPPEVIKAMDPKRKEEIKSLLKPCQQFDPHSQNEEYQRCFDIYLELEKDSLIILNHLNQMYAKESDPPSEKAISDDKLEELGHWMSEFSKLQVARLDDAITFDEAETFVELNYPVLSEEDKAFWEKVANPISKPEIDQPDKPLKDEKPDALDEEVANPEPVIEHRPCFRKEYEKLETWVPAECDEQYLEEMRAEAIFLGNITDNQGHNCSAELNRNAWNYAKNMMFCLYEVLPKSRAEHLPLVLKNVSRYPNVTSASEAVFLYVRYAAYKECNVFYIKDISKNFKGIMAQRNDNRAFYNDESLGNILTFCKSTKEINEIGHTAAVQLLRNILISKVIYESHSKPETLEENVERLVKYRSKKLPLVEESHSIYKNSAADNTVFDETMDPGDLFLIQKRCDIMEVNINPEIDTIVELSKKPVPTKKMLEQLVDHWLEFVNDSDEDIDDIQANFAAFSKILSEKYPPVCASYITFTICVRLQIAYVGFTNQKDLQFNCNDLIASLKQ